VGSIALGCVEFAVPGKVLEDKLKVLESAGMWLELVNGGLTASRRTEIFEVLPSFDVPVRTVQANLLRDLRPLGSRKKDREAAVEHVEETIELASELGAQNVVTVATYGEPAVKNPLEKCVEMYEHFGRLGEEVGVTVSIEALGKNRTTFLPGISEVSGLVHRVGSSFVRPMADTMHIYDNGDDVAETVRRYAGELSELQLRDVDSKPPGSGKIDFESVLREIHGKFNGLMCLEYHPGPDPHADFARARDFINKLISKVR
jgi:sugar phosphate isomerase/epimerase